MSFGRSRVNFLLVALVGAASAHATELTLEWRHRDAELVLVGRELTAGEELLAFELRSRRSDERHAFRMGYPRARSTGPRWRDVVSGGDLPRDRVLQPSEDTASRFWISLPSGWRELEFSLGPSMVRLSDGEVMGVAAAVTPAAPTLPVRLVTELRWKDEPPFGDGALEPGESGELFVDVTNLGPRTAESVEVRLTADGSTGVILPAPIVLPRIDPAETVAARVVIRGAESLDDDGPVRLTVHTEEAFGHVAAAIEVELPTRSRGSATLELLGDFVVTVPGDPGRMLLPVPRDTVVTVRLRVRNIGAGDAEAVVVEIVPGEGVFRAGDGSAVFELGDLAPGEYAELDYGCYANARAEALDLNVRLVEGRPSGPPGSDRVVIPLSAESTVRSVRLQAEPSVVTPLPDPPAPLISQIDRELPRAGAVRPEGLAIVLGVEQYRNAPSARWASDDARTAGRFFRHVLGIPEHRVLVLTDAEVTLGQFRRIFEPGGWLERRVRPDSDVFVFFAGHGAALTANAAPYLIPADGDPQYVAQTGFALARLLKAVAGLDARQATVFVDACFSGLTRGGMAVDSGSRPMALVASADHVPGVSLFAATSGGQIAGALDAEGHGLFSYSLFLGLGGEADLNRDDVLTSGELRDFLNTAVPSAAERQDREQRPSASLVSAESVLVRWREIDPPARGGEVVRSDP